MEVSTQIIKIWITDEKRLRSLISSIQILNKKLLYYHFLSLDRFFAYLEARANGLIFFSGLSVSKSDERVRDFVPRSEGRFVSGANDLPRLPSPSAFDFYFHTLLDPPIFLLFLKKPNMKINFYQRFNVTEKLLQFVNSTKLKQ